MASRATQKVRAVAEEVVAKEGPPVHLEQLARLVAASFELSRVNQTRADSILAAVAPILRLDEDEPFAWPLSIEPAESLRDEQSSRSWGA